MRKLWSDDAWKDYLFWQEHDRKKLKKINSLIREIERNGYSGSGKPEPLKGALSGFWSIRIDEKNRIVYRITDGFLEILQCRTHYGAK